MAREIVEDAGARMVSSSLTIRRTPDELYREWRALEKLADIMEEVVSVVQLDEQRSHWVVSAPGGTAEWDAELVEDVPNQVISWRTIGDADVEHSGEVRFLPARQGPGTELRVVLRWRPPARSIGAAVAKMTGHDPARQLDDDLQRFKHRMETGYASTTHGQPRGAAQADDLQEEREELLESESKREAQGAR